MRQGEGFEGINVWEMISEDFERDARITMAAFRTAIQSAEAAARAEVAGAEGALARARAQTGQAGRAEGHRYACGYSAEDLRVDDYLETLSYCTRPPRLLRSMALVALVTHLERARCRWEGWAKALKGCGFERPRNEEYSGWAAVEGMMAVRNRIVHQAGYIDTPLPPISVKGEAAPAPQPPRGKRIPKEYRAPSGEEVEVKDEILERDIEQAVAFVQWLSATAHRNEQNALTKPGRNCE